ncbi:MAG: type II CRISPR-associated endonuclease Cas1 [Bacteroidia bacterium]|nr:type II CRISPR-associated endonuclease Cas1 [Bacteroidia bacterium]
MIKRTFRFNNPCYLSLENEQMVVSYNRINGQEELPDRKAAIEDIGIIILEHKQITLTHALMGKLIENNAALITCNETHHPTGLLLNLDGHTNQSERFRAQQEASIPLRKQLWQQTIKAKIANQAKMLRIAKAEFKYLERLSSMVKSGDADNHEAQAAAYYWPRLFAPAWNFYRRREGEPPNNLLNYGYAILRAAVARELVVSGLLPTFGIHHRNRYNSYCLADDIMEPYRPFVDHVVWNILQETSTIERLTNEHKRRLVEVLTQDVKMDGETSPLQIALNKTTSSLAKCFLGKAKRISYPIGP